jgi:hypothetical protein
MPRNGLEIIQVACRKLEIQNDHIIDQVNTSMDEIELRCPACKAVMSAELTTALESGKTVVCETCGITLIPKFAAEAKLPAKGPSSPGETTIPVAPAKARPRHRQRDRMAIKPVPPIPPIPPRKGTRATRERRNRKLVDRAAKELPRARASLHRYNEVSGILLRVFIGLFVALSVLYLVLGFLIGPDKFDMIALLKSLLQFFPYYLMAGYMYWYDSRRLQPWLKRDQYEFFGIDILVVGLAGLFVYGIGILLVFKGLAVMRCMILQDRISPRSRRSVLVDWINGLDEVSWQMVAIAATNSFAVVISILILAPTPVEPSLLAGWIFVVLCGMISANGDLRRVSPHIRDYQFERLGGKSLFRAVLGTICLASGIPMLVKAILIYNIENEPADEEKLPDHALVIKAPDQEEPVNPPPAIEPITPQVPPARAIEDRHDFHGPNGPAPPSGRLPAREPDQPQAGSVEAYLKRQFSVLTPKVRRSVKKLERLGLTRQEMNEISAELTHHPEFEQLEIIDEYIRMNKDDIDPVHVLAVREMQVPEELKNQILEQLRYIPPKDIPAFLEDIRQSQA